MSRHIQIGLEEVLFSSNSIPISAKLMNMNTCVVFIENKELC